MCDVESSIESGGQSVKYFLDDKDLSEDIKSYWERLFTFRVRTQPSSCSSGIVFFSFLSPPQKSIQPDPELGAAYLLDSLVRVGEASLPVLDGEPRFVSDDRLCLASCVSSQGHGRF